MKIVDANIVLRYFLKDNIEQFKKAEKILEENEVLIAPEIIAEIIYVLQKMYKVPREKIKDKLQELISNENVHIDNYEIQMEMLNIYGASNLDYADCLLYSISKHTGYEISSFDEELLKAVKKKKY